VATLIESAKGGPSTSTVDSSSNTSSKSQQIDPPFSDSYQPCNKSKASDYAPTGEVIIIHAARKYECNIITDEAFPDPTTHVTCAKDCFKTSSRTFEENFKITKCIITLVWLSCLNFPSLTVFRLAVMVLVYTVLSWWMSIMQLCQHMASS
jgi:hypothetical protein